MSAIERLGIELSESAASGEVSEQQAQTRDAFGFKWSKRQTYESQAMQENCRRWLHERYCNNDRNCLDNWLAGGRKIIMEVGCGSGNSAMLLFGDALKDHDYLGVDISSAVDVARTRFEAQGYKGDFLMMDMFQAPIPDGAVDVMFAEGVLHHTDSTERALKHLAKKLKIGGRFLFYVYARKSVIREFTDDFIRERLKGMTDEEAWNALEPLTKLGEALGKLQATVEVPEDVPLLGMKKGSYDLQRFFYWHICKMYYRPELMLDEMNLINFDWFRPLNCHRHTPEEITAWCAEAGLNIERMDVQEAGITVVAVKEGGRAI